MTIDTADYPGWHHMIGRIIGWAFLLLALLGASAEAVMALGTEPYETVATGEVWTLLSGQVVPSTPHGVGLSKADVAIGWLMALPAWVVFAVLGLGLTMLFRRQVRRPRRAGMAGMRGMRTIQHQ